MNAVADFWSVSRVAFFCHLPVSTGMWVVLNIEGYLEDPLEKTESEAK